MERLFPPFDPDDLARRARLRPMPQIPIRRLLPNLVTIVALCAGLTSMRMAVEGKFEIAVYCILFAALLDAVDGRVARLLRATSSFGAQLDSLTDFVNFGVAPAILLFAWSLTDLGSIGWVGAIVFAICCALRLARFNAALDAPDKPAWHGGYFTGVPAPAGAITAMLPLYVEFLGAPHGFWTAPVVLAYMIVVGLLMISRWPTWSGKKIGARVPRDMVLPLFVGFAIAAALLVSFPWLVLTIITLGYLGTLPMSWRTWHDHKRTDEEAKAAAEQAGAPRLTVIRDIPPAAE